MLTGPPNPRKRHLPGRKTSPGRTHQIGNILHGLQAAQMPQTREGEVTGLSHCLEADSHGENQALAQLEQWASMGQRQTRLSGQPRAWMPARASGLTLGQEGFRRAAVGWMAPGGLGYRRESWTYPATAPRPRVNRVHGIRSTGGCVCGGGGG